MGALAVAGALFLSCRQDEARIEEQLKQMTLEEKVGQLFCIRPEALDSTIHYQSAADLPAFALQEVNDRMREMAARYPVGGIILFAHNIKDPEQLTRFQADLRTLAGKPLLYVDEEGGRVARLANNPAFGLPKYENMTVFHSPREVREAAFTIGSYLSRYGFDVDFAPVADVNTNPENIVIGTRAFSDKPKVAAKMVRAYVKGLHKAGVQSCLKHFPGHGDTQADTHFGYAVTHKNWAEMASCEMLPFKAGIAAGADLVMSAHISAPAVTGTEIPSTLSPVILQDKLRGELGFKGVIITDAMGMKAVSDRYSSGESAVMTLQAGADIVLMPENLPEAFEAVLSAVEDGTLPESRIDESVRRILALKLSLQES